MKKLFAIALCVCMILTIVACAPATTPPTATDPVVTEAEYKLGMGVVVSTASSKTGLAQVDATVATVVTDKDGKIVAARIDVAQSKFDLGADFAAESTKNFKTKMELGSDYGMAGKVDNNGDGVMKEWFEQADVYAKYVVGKTGAEVVAMETELVNNHYISKDKALLDAGCTIQITAINAVMGAACDYAR